ncbi:TrbG/VirB9 family P-type conjugative transfer protein [Novosphingobium sp. ERN07]|uniref:TrbG/VirB9 family P-type conjugative transfer protein n=1 Tax=Novosphingobium sp. ERN07 TaxID=2726187 RepID=UPI0014573546|nr:TrbG/VirB9 family P-type conjugative transfer protein [Novosphingobium sp. ERN07]NLR73389.1 TrbG/VirB9 family P-type conjugative transfer protein [Novosphingobium sp. ERN07]
MKILNYLAFGVLVAAYSPHSAVIANPRIIEVKFDSDAVVHVSCELNRQTMIEFDKGERIENIAIGEAEDWQVTPSKGANLIFIKPLVMKSKTNMTVVTNARRYLFDLSSMGNVGSGIYALRFRYPEELVLPFSNELQQEVSHVPQAVSRPDVYPYSWQMAGDATLFPEEIYDDGSFTFLKWKPGLDVPAIFSPTIDGQEGPVNWTMSSDVIRVDGVQSSYVLRIGKIKAVLTRSGPMKPIEKSDNYGSGK